MRRTTLLVSATALYTMAVACGGGRNLDAGADDEPVVVVIVTDDDDGGPSVGGGGLGGMSEGGFGGEGGAGEGGGGGIMPIECLTCIGTECPDAIGCVTDPTCIQGVVCAVSQCLGGGGMPDFMCLLDCFDGDIDAALSAVDALTCIAGSCSDACGNLIPFP
ncbi:MAG: hypothetical protein RIF41_38405 [Polyangiaceae bacterium]